MSGRAALRVTLEIIRSDQVERYTLAADETDGIVAKTALGPLKRRLNLREINHCIKSSLFLKNSIYLASDAESAAKSGFTAAGIQAATRGILKKYPRVPGFLLKMALYANLSAEAVASTSIKIPAAARLVSLFAELGFHILSAGRNQSGLQELESTLLAAMRDELGDEQKDSVDCRLLEELVTIAEEQSW